MGMLWYISTWVMALNRIKMLRKERGLTQAQLAQKLNISASSVGMYEQGRRSPDLEMYRRLADVFDVPLGVVTSDLPYHKEPVEWKDFVDQVIKHLTQQEGILVDGSPLSNGEIEELTEAIQEAVSSKMLKYKK